MTQTLDVDQTDRNSPPPVASTQQPEFSGRAWFFDDLNAWLGGESPSNWLITAEPGWGKSALAREIVRRVPGSLLWTAAGTVAPWKREEVEQAPFVVIDGFGVTQGFSDLHAWLAQQQIPGPVLIFSRPNRGFLRAQLGGMRLTHQESHSSENLADVSQYLQRFSREFANSVLARSGGNFLMATLLSRPGSQESDIVEVLWDIVLGVVHAAPSDYQTDLFKMLCLMAESGEPLDTEQFVDFLGIGAARTQALLTCLRPLLRNGPRHQLFSPWVARALSVQLLRDMEGTHASVIAFFRETYPSWDEMSDSYGWHHLGHHCDRYARTGKKRDFSILHWLTEGPYVRIKLVKTRALVSTLQDLRRGLEAALLEWDLPRIISYGFVIPRLRREMAAPIVHELADKGELLRSGHHVGLLAQESSRYLANLLLAWQSADEGHQEWAEGFLRTALSTPLPELESDDLPLVTNICAALLKALPQQQESILHLLELEESPLRAARNFLSLGLLENVEEGVRERVLHLGKTRTRLLHNSEHHRLALFVERCLSFGKGVAALDEEGFVAKITALSEEKLDAHAIDGLFDLSERALALDPRPDWVDARLSLVVGVLGQIKAAPERFRGLTMLGRFLILLGGEDEALEVLEKLATVAQDFEDAAYRCRALAEVGVSFHKVGQSVRSNQLISQAASLAFQQDPPSKGRLLNYIAGAAAQIGNATRARDLAFNALEATDGGGGYFEVHCRGALKQGVLANISAERSLEMLKFYAENCNSQEIDPKVKALSLAAVAESAHRLGYFKEARSWLEMAVCLARSNLAALERSYLLARLASSEHLLGERTRYETLLQESMEALLGESDPMLRAEALMTLVEVRHGCRDPHAHAVEKTLIKELAALDPAHLLQSRTLLRLAQAKLRGHVSDKVQELFDRARAALDSIGPGERDAAILQHLRLELALGQTDLAVSLLGKIGSIRRRAAALADLAESQILDLPQQALGWLTEIPLRQERLSAILRCTTRLAGELRPSRQRDLHEVMAHLTILATEDEGVADVLLSRWIQSTTDPRLLDRTARKLGWIEEEKSPLQPLTLRQQS